MWQGYKTILWKKTFSHSVPLLQYSVCLILLIITTLSPFFLFGYFSGLFICSFHLPRLSPGPLIYTAATAPLGQTGLRRHSLCTLKGQCVHTDMKGWTKTENGFLRKHPETWDKWREKEKDTRRKENAQAPPSIFMSSKAEVPESCIWESDMMLPWTTALKLLWRLPFWKGWDFRRLICCWITLGDFWLAQSRPGHTAAVSGDGGLKQMAWPNQGECAVVRSCVCTWVCLSVWLWVLEFLWVYFRKSCMCALILVCLCLRKNCWKRCNKLGSEDRLTRGSVTKHNRKYWSWLSWEFGAQNMWTLFSSSFNAIDSRKKHRSLIY